MSECNSKDLLTANRTFTSDEKGKRIAAFNYDVNDQIISIDSFKYDLNGNRIQDITYRLDHTVRLWELMFISILILIRRTIGGNALHFIMVTFT